ncbi:MAG: aspartate/glutamate racemase family protein [Anaerolineaceae bacterium]
MKTAGILGGFGPQTTAKFYEEVFFACQKKNPIIKPHILISSVSLPFQIENISILKNEGVEDYLPYLVTEAQRLEKAGADFIVMPCNSLHIHIDAIRACVNIPMLSIIHESALFLAQKSISRVGLLSTAMTAQHRLYEKELAEHRIFFETPNDSQQCVLNQIVFNLVNAKSNKDDRDHLLEIMQSFVDIECILLACTDLQLLNLALPDMPIFDTMQILVDSTAREILK